MYVETKYRIVLMEDDSYVIERAYLFPYCPYLKVDRKYWKEVTFRESPYPGEFIMKRFSNIVDAKDKIRELHEESLAHYKKTTVRKIICEDESEESVEIKDAILKEEARLYANNAFLWGLREPLELKEFELRKCNQRVNR